MNHLVAVVGIDFVGLSPIWVALADVSPATATFFRSIYALPRLAALETSLLMLVQPMVSLIVAALVLSERISWRRVSASFSLSAASLGFRCKAPPKPAKGEQEWISDGTTSRTHTSSSGV